MFCFCWILTFWSEDINYVMPFLWSLWLPTELNLFKWPLNFSYYFPTKPILFAGNIAASVFFWVIFAFSVFFCSFSLNFLISLCFRCVSNEKHYLDFSCCYSSPNLFCLARIRICMCACIHTHMYINSGSISTTAISLWTVSLELCCSKPLCSFLFSAVALDLCPVPIRDSLGAFQPQNYFNS